MSNPRSLKALADWYQARQDRRDGKTEKKKHKYGAEKVKSASGYSYASKLECSVHAMLVLREKAGEIKILQIQPVVKIELPPGSGNRWGCRPDFKCLDIASGKEFYVEAKGLECDRFKATRFIWIAAGPAPMELWKGTHQRPVLVEIIVPEVSPQAG